VVREKNGLAALSHRGRQRCQHYPRTEPGHALSAARHCPQDAGAFKKTCRARKLDGLSIFLPLGQFETVCRRCQSEAAPRNTSAHKLPAKKQKPARSALAKNAGSITAQLFATAQYGENAGSPDRRGETEERELIQGRNRSHRSISARHCRTGNHSEGKNKKPPHCSDATHTHLP